jgi:hypothetical protein
MGARFTYVANPLDVLAAKRLLDSADVFMIRMAVLTALDAAKRGLATGRMANTLSQHLLTACAIWSQQGNRPAYVAGAKAWAAHSKALARPTSLLDLTTGEYAAIRLAVRHYVIALPLLEMGAYLAAQLKAVTELEGE